MSVVFGKSLRDTTELKVVIDRGLGLVQGAAGFEAPRLFLETTTAGT